MDIEGILAILLIFGGGACVALGFSPIGRAVADRIRGKHGQADGDTLRAELAEQREAMTDEVQHLRSEMAELAERLDFAERLLAKQRDPQRVGPGNAG